MKDPWTWTVDEVVNNLCYSDDLWADRSNSKRPNAAQFEQKLREESIDGATLLEHVDRPTLGQDLGVRSLGEAAAILFAIDKLRNVSTLYVGQKASQLTHTQTISDVATSVRQPTRDLSRSLYSEAPSRGSSALKREPSALPLPGLRNVRARPGEILVESVEGGKKRRKLQLTMPTTPLINTSFETPGSYLGKSKLALDVMFFDKSKPLIDESETNEFVYINNKQKPVLAGVQTFIERRMRHLYRTEPEFLDQNHKVVLRPYQPQLALSHSAHALLFTRDDSQVHVSKRNAVMLDLEIDDNDQVNNHWDFLSKWDKIKDDKILPLYNESGSEMDYDESLLDEIEQEKEEKERDKIQTVSRYLTKDHIRSLIDDCIQQQEKTWQEEKLPVRQNRAWSIWKKYRGARRPQAVSNLKHEIDRLSSRVEKVKQAMCDEQWTKDAHVQDQCRSLEPTVSERMEHRWQLNVLGSLTPPSRPLRLPKVDVKIKPTHDADGDEESLHSESDVAGDMDDILDIDDDMPGDFAADDRVAGVGVDVSEVNTADRDAPASHSGNEGISHSAESKSATITSSRILEWPETPRKARSLTDDSILGLPISNTQPVAMSSEDLIDLTMSSPQSPTDHEKSSDEKSSAELEKKLFPPSSPLHEDQQVVPEYDWEADPTDATSAQIDAWDFEDLRDLHDPKRIVLKLLHALDQEARDDIDDHVASVPSKTMRHEVQDAIKALKKNLQKLGGRSNPATVFAIAKLWLCWKASDNRPMSNPLMALDTSIDIQDFDSYHKFLQSLIETNAVHEKEVVSGSRRKKRKQKKTAMRPELTNLHNEAQQRKALFEETQQSMPLFQASQQSNGDGDPLSQEVLINPMKGDNEDWILVNQYISGKMKPHQIEGVRFIWRELVTTGESSQGCLLAHTMGLGKSMQAITVLVTIAEAASSDNPAISDQIPEHLRQSRTLLLCPPGLVENWKDEWRKWQPQPASSNVGAVRDVGGLKPRDRVAQIGLWYNEGGVLIMGYELFRVLLENKKKKGSDTSPLSEEDHANIKEWLLEGPNIVVADEAHKLKNKNSKVGQRAQEFRTTSRLALTGSPLSNNLHEYWVMIDFVAPGYLGTVEEFREHYQEPIEQGTYADSTKSEQRKSLKKLRALMADIEPKVQRKDVTAISKDLKQKTEFVLNIPLTGVQHDAYKVFVRALREASSAVATTKLFDWLSVLTLLCDHPATFLEKLQERHDKSKSKISAADIENGSPDIAAMGLPDIMLERQQAIFEGLKDVDDVRLSHKMALIKDIILESKRVGDKVLIFSHLMPTLRFLNVFISKLKPTLRVDQLDGTTKMKNRLELSKRMNAGQLDVLLISTRAGGLGLNIPGANRVILVDFSFNPSHEEQAVGRAYRLGQQKPVFVYHMVTAGTFEERLHQITIFKQQLAQRVVDKKSPARSAVKVEEMLFEPQSVEQEDLSGAMGLDSVLDKVLQNTAGKAVRSIKTADKLHKESDEKLTAEEEEEVNKLIEMDKLRHVDPAAFQRKRQEQQATEQIKQWEAIQALNRANPASAHFAASWLPTKPQHAVAMPPPSTASVMQSGGTGVMSATLGGNPSTFSSTQSAVHPLKPQVSVPGLSTSAKSQAEVPRFGKPTPIKAKVSSPPATTRVQQPRPAGSADQSTISPSQRTPAAEIPRKRVSTLLPKPPMQVNAGQGGVSDEDVDEVMGDTEKSGNALKLFKMGTLGVIFNNPL